MQICHKQICVQLNTAFCQWVSKLVTQLDSESVFSPAHRQKVKEEANAVSEGVAVLLSSDKWRENWLQKLKKFKAP
jgi:hypothetical protein